MRDHYNFVNALSFGVGAATFVSNLTFGVGVSTSFWLAAECTTALMGAGAIVIVSPRVGPELCGVLGRVFTFVARVSSPGAAFLLEDMEADLQRRPKQILITPDQKKHMDNYNRAIREKYITMLVEQGELVRVAEPDGRVRMGYRVIAGFSEPQMFFPSNDVIEQVTLLKQTRSWQGRITSKAEIPDSNQQVFVR